MTTADNQDFMTIITECLRAFQTGACGDADYLEFEGALREPALSDSDKLRYYQQAGEVLFSRSCYDKAAQYLEQSLGLARRHEALSDQAVALGLLAEIDRLHGQYRDAFSKTDRALTILDKVHDQPLRARILIVAGLNDISLGLYDSAQERFLEAYQLYRQLGDNHGTALALVRLGTAAMMMEEYPAAEKWLQEALVLCRTVNDQHGLAGALINLGEVCRQQGDVATAYQNYQEARQAFAQLGLTRGVSIAENNMGHLMVMANDWRQAKRHYERAFEIASRDSLIPEMLDTLAGLALMLVQQGQARLAYQLTSVISRHPARLDETEKLLAPVAPRLSEWGASLSVAERDSLVQPVPLQHLFEQALQAA